MKERPILFSTPMVRAILDGLKTQTRRIVKFLPQYGDANYVRIKSDNRISRYDPIVSIEHQDAYAACPYGIVGDHLWVRESFGWGPTGKGETLVYKATHDGPMHNKWSPSIHMPREASRITLEITNVRVERLQDISDAGASLEGVPSSQYGCFEHYVKDRSKVWNQVTCKSMRQGFAELWDKINGKKNPWDSNPWCWVVEFKKL